MTNVHASDTSVVVPPGWTNEDFTLRRSQRLALVALGLLVVVLAGGVLKTSNNTVDNLKVMSDVGSTTNHMIITQRESLVFAFAFEQWLSGTIPRRDLQIRRALLAQRLAVRDNMGVSSGTRVHPEYFTALGVLDDYMEAAVPGFLPPDDQTVLRSKSTGALHNFIFEARELIVGISRASDEQIRQFIRHEDSRRRNQYVVVLVVLTLVVLIAALLEVSRHRDHRLIRAQARKERLELEEIRAVLQRADLALESRLYKERIDSAEQEWIDSIFRSISSQFKGTIVPDEIAELLVENLGRALGADLVHLFTFADSHGRRIWKQWHQRTDDYAEESLVIEYESGLSSLVEHLWSQKRVIIVADSHLIDVSRDPLPELTAIMRERARSWMTVPVGEGSQVLGYMWITMAENTRVWSSAEVALTQKVTSDMASVLIQARMFNQTMQIAEHAAMVNRLVELDKTKNDFIENMNHELRTPLTSIIGYMEMIIGDVDARVEPVLAASLAAVQRNAVRLQMLIENMMQVSKSDFEHVPLTVSTVDIGHLLEDVVKLMGLTADDGGVKMTLRLDSPADDLLIDGDVNQLEQVFVNLVSNAIKFTPRGGKVAVVARRAHADGDYVEVKVTDTGIGILAEDFPNVFKRFFRASTATQSAIPGFGIGLSLVQSIVREHRGTITFDSTVGKGTVFTVRLPARFESAGPRDETT